MDELFAAKDRAWEKFCTLPGVHAVGIGKKVVGGVRTDETVLTVFVTRKLPLADLAPEAVVPPMFDGFTTDIVESPMAVTLNGPVTITEQVIPNGKSFTFSTTVDPLPKGVRVILTVRLHTATGDEDFFYEIKGDGLTEFDGNLHRLAGGIKGPFFNVTLTGTTLAITPVLASESLDASCYTLLADRHPYAHEFLRGGILIQGGSMTEGGTLGCIGTLKSTTEYPQGRTVAVTCSHVVRNYHQRQTLLKAEVDGTRIDLLYPPSATIPAHVVLAVYFSRRINAVPVFFISEGSAFYTTSDAESLQHIAAGLAVEIGKAGIPGVSATSISVGPNHERITVTGFTGSIDCYAHPAAEPPVGPQLEAEVTRDPTGDHRIRFNGSVQASNHGIFVDIDNTGFAATFGVFHNPTIGQSVTNVAAAISKAINETPPAQRGLVSSTAIGDTVRIAAAKYVRVWVEPDIRVGQPIDFYNKARCCDFRIGRVLDARIQLDVALIQLDAGIKYKHHIQELNAVSGTQAPTLGLAVQKRGAVTGLTEGMVTAIGMSGFVGGARGLTRIFHNGFVVASTILDTGGRTLRPFSSAGDSGSAVVTKGPGPPKIVGVLFSGGIVGATMVTPIDDVLETFKHLDLSFTPAVGVDLNAVHTVPAPATNFQALDADDVRLGQGPLAGGSLAALGQRVLEAEQAIGSTAIGRDYADLVRRNLGEALDLVNRNRRVATVWHRSGGPELLNAILRVIRFDDEPLPCAIGGRPLGECLARLRAVFQRYASPQLSRDIARLTASLTDCSGMTYPQMLAALREESR